MNCWKITKLQTYNFRNLKNDVFNFSPGINCIFGNNGNGKTNLLEAVYFLTNKKSFRKNTDYSQIINIEGENSEILIKSVFEKDNQSSSLSIRLKDSTEERYLDNKFVKSGSLSLSVFINPFDSYQFHNNASFRRQWFDSHLSQEDKEYKKNLTSFQKSMRFRNSLLSMRTKNLSDQLRAIDEQISEQSEILTRKREEFTRLLNNFIQPTFKEIFAEENELEIKLESLFANWNKARIFDFYRYREQSDVESGITQVGIQKDDYLLEINGLSAFEFGSLGQQKMAFLSLIFAYIELFRYKFSSYPIVLIDDVSGELDGQRWKNLIKYLESKNFQVLITTANKDFGRELEKISASKKFCMEHGKLINHG